MDCITRDTQGPSLRFSELLSFDSKEVWEIEEFHLLILKMEEENQTTRSCLKLVKNRSKFYNLFSVFFFF